MQKILFYIRHHSRSDYHKTPTVIHQLKDAPNAVYYPAGPSNVKYRPEKPSVSKIDQQSIQCQISTRKAYRVRYRPEKPTGSDIDQRSLQC